MEDGFVKEPAVITQKNFDASKFKAEKLEKIKLEDGVRLHENVKVELETYARQTSQRVVKPFGWDVTNLYTIVPLRAANARILIEQSIGRGLRLPYGRRTGVAAVDRLNIIAHDKFQEILDEANKPTIDFERCLYPVQKFQSDTERKLAIILDRESLKWFKPALGQFQIFYKSGLDHKEYQPDFATELPAAYSSPSGEISD